MWQLKCLQSFQVSTGKYHCFGRISVALVKVVKGRSSILVIGNRTECFPGSSAGKESACNAGDPGLIPGLRSSPGEGIGYPLRYSWASLVAQTVKNPPAVQETLVRSLGWEDALEEGMATLSSVLAWRITMGEEPGRLQSTGWQTIGHDRVTKHSTAQQENRFQKNLEGNVDNSQWLVCGRGRRRGESQEWPRFLALLTGYVSS